MTWELPEKELELRSIPINNGFDGFETSFFTTKRSILSPSLVFSLSGLWIMNMVISIFSISDPESSEEFKLTRNSFNGGIKENTNINGSLILRMSFESLLSLLVIDCWCVKHLMMIFVCKSGFFFFFWFGRRDLLCVWYVVVWLFWFGVLVFGDRTWFWSGFGGILGREGRFWLEEPNSTTLWVLRSHP